MPLRQTQLNATKHNIAKKLIIKQNKVMRKVPLLRKHIGCNCLPTGVFQRVNVVRKSVENFTLKRLSEIHKNCRSQVFFKIAVFKNFAIFTRKHICWNLFLIKLQASWSATLSKRDSIVYTAKFLRASFFRSRPVAASEKQNDSSKSNLLHIFFLETVH